MPKPIVLDNTVLTNLALVEQMWLATMIAAGYRAPVSTLDDLCFSKS